MSYFLCNYCFLLIMKKFKSTFRKTFLQKWAINCVVWYQSFIIHSGLSSLGVPDVPWLGRSVNPISTRGDRLYPPNYYWHTRIFILSDGSDSEMPEQFLVTKYFFSLFLEVSKIWWIRTIIIWKIEKLEKIIGI